MPAANGYRAENDRPSAAKRGYGHGWRKLRAGFLEENPDCECGCKATVVDHRRSMDAGGSPTAPSNLQGMCHSCHSRKTATKNRARTNVWESRMNESTPNAQRLINEAVIKLSEDRKAAERWLDLLDTIRFQASSFGSGSPFPDTLSRDHRAVLKNGIPDDNLTFDFSASKDSDSKPKVDGWTAAHLTISRWVNLNPNVKDWCEMWVYISLEDKDVGDDVCLKVGSVLDDQFDSFAWSDVVIDFFEHRLGLERRDRK